MNKFTKIFLYFLTKYFLFYICGAIESNNFSIFKINNIKNFEDVFFYLWLILFFPILNFVVFFLPIYYSFELKKYQFLFLNLILILFEIFIFIYFTSQKYIIDIDILILFSLSIICFTIFFYRYIKNETTNLRKR